MSEKKRKSFMKNWAKARKMGKLRYILTQGIVWGLITYFLFNGLRIIFGSEYSTKDLWQDISGPAWWINLFVLILVGGPILRLDHLDNIREKF